MPSPNEPAPPPPDAPGSPPGIPLEDAVVRQPEPPRHGPLPPAPFGGLDALWAALLGFAMTVAFIAIEGRDGTSPAGIVFLTGFLGIAAAMWTGLRYRTGALALAGPDLPRPGGLAAGIAGGFAALIGQVVIVVAIQPFVELGPTAQEEFAREVLDLATPWLLVVTFAVVAPVAEEIFFRGLLFRGLLRHGRGIAYVVSSLLFGLAHVQLTFAGSVLSVFNATWVGLLFAWLFERYRSLAVAIVAHACLNGIAVTAGLLAG